MKKVLLLLSAVSMTLLASEHAAQEGGTDFWWRLVNFIIFAVIIYKLVADKIVAFFKAREQGIADELTALEKRLKEAKVQKQEALEEAEKSTQKAEELKVIAQEEAKLLEEKIAQNLALEKEQLERSHHERVEIETKKMKQEVVSEVIEELFGSKGVQMSNEDLLNIIKKRVA